MTDTKVAQLSAMLQGLQSVSSATGTFQKTEAAFGTMLAQTASKGYEQQYAWTSQIGNNTVLTGSNQAVYEKETAQNNFKDTSFVKKSNSDIASKLPKDASEQLENITNEVKNVLKEKLNISEEELVQAMEQLGISMLDLADPTKLTQLVMELTGSQEGSELLLNPDFQALTVQVQELFQQLTESLNLTPEEMQQLSEQLKVLQENTSVENMGQSQTEEISEIQQPQTETNVQDNIALTETKETEVQSTTAEEKKVSDIADIAKEVNDTTEQITAQTTVSQTAEATENQADGEAEMAQEDTNTSENQETEVKTQVDAKSEQTQVSYQTTTQTVNNGQTVEVVQTVTQTQVDVENILRQISQMTKISVTQAQSSIEMQLNPENLGKVYLQVVSKEGAITAQIATQNEAVKQVLESQIAVLKENMNQQGMKVEAIEVTIASHEFEQNLEGKQEHTSRGQQEQEKTSRRGINLNRLDELEGLMSEEESLAAKIMQDNGNSVDLTA